MDARALIALRGSLSGYVDEPGAPGYDQTVDIDNGRVTLRPAVVVHAGSYDDVATTMRFAQDEGLPLTVRGGGHSAAGYCLNDGGVVLTLDLLNAVSFDEDSAVMKAQMGATWIEVYETLVGSTSLIPIGGGCLPVGLPGFVLGGGFSFVSRSYGLASDNLLALTLVTPDGETRRLSDEGTDEAERDLFWACRGGGGGNFGVAVEMELRLHRPNAPKMLVARPRWPAERAPEILDFYNDWVESVPHELALYGYWGTEPDQVDPTLTDRTFGFTIVYNGDFGDGLDLIEPLIRRDPAHIDLENLPLPEIEEVIGGTTVVGNRSAYMWSGILPPRAFTPDLVEPFAAHMAAAPSSASFVVWTHLGGKVEEGTPDLGAFPFRRARFVPELKTIWDRGHPELARANVEWARDFFEALRPSLLGAYLNYIDPLLADWHRMYYGDNYDRLLEIKRRWDPDRIFDFQQSIGSSFEPSLEKPLDLSPLNRTFVPRGAPR